MPSAPGSLTPAFFYATMGRHQAILAIFDIAQHPEKETELREAFDRMDDEILDSNVDAALGVRHALAGLVYVAANGLKIPKGGNAPDPFGTDHSRALARLSEGLSSEASEAILLARESPTTYAFTQAAGPRRSAGPLPNSALVDAAVVAVRALARQHGDPGADSWWKVLGQLFGTICLGSS